MGVAGSKKVAAGEQPITAAQVTAVAPAAQVTGMVLDCGSGHTSILWYGQGFGAQIKQLRRSKLKLPGGGNFKITDVFGALNADSAVSRNGGLAESAKAFAAALCAEIEDARSASSIPQPALIFVGATGGLREGLAEGRVREGDVQTFREHLVDGLPSSSNSTFSVITGAEEAGWELAAAHTIYNPHVGSMFPSADGRPVSHGTFGLFSGGGSSMQVQEWDQPGLSFPFGTWCEEIDEAKGAAIDAWQDAAKWGRWEASLLSRIAREETTLPNRFTGHFVLTAMNHVAATAAGFAEVPITASAAVMRLRAALAQFRQGSGEPFQGFVDARHSVHPTVLAWYSSQPPTHLARVGAMHICRLMHVLEQLFEPEARLFAPPGLLDGERLDCEWTLQAFAKTATATAPPTAQPSEANVLLAQARQLKTQLRDLGYELTITPL
jgi:hypothetical protein